MLKDEDIIDLAIGLGWNTVQRSGLEAVKVADGVWLPLPISARDKGTLAVAAIARMRELEYGFEMEIDEDGDYQVCVWREVGMYFTGVADDFCEAVSIAVRMARYGKNG